MLLANRILLENCYEIFLQVRFLFIYASIFISEKCNEQYLKSIVCDFKLNKILLHYNMLNIKSAIFKI